jgi:hypothetical protein
MHLQVDVCSLLWRCLAATSILHNILSIFNTSWHISYIQMTQNPVCSSAHEIGFLVWRPSISKCKALESWNYLQVVPFKFKIGCDSCLFQFFLKQHHLCTCHQFPPIDFRVKFNEPYVWIISKIPHQQLLPPLWCRVIKKLLLVLKVPLIPQLLQDAPSNIIFVVIQSIRSFQENNMYYYSDLGPVEISTQLSVLWEEYRIGIIGV